MLKILTSDQFVAGVIATLALAGHKRFVLTDTELDQRFQNAFEDLTSSQEALNVLPNFTFFVDPIHGDSVSLRDALLSAKEKELIALNNPTFRTFDIKLTSERAKRYLDKNPLPQTYFEQLVSKYFSNISQ